MSAPSSTTLLGLVRLFKTRLGLVLGAFLLIAPLSGPLHNAVEQHRLCAHDEEQHRHHVAEGEGAHHGHEHAHEHGHAHGHEHAHEHDHEHEHVHVHEHHGHSHEHLRLAQVGSHDEEQSGHHHCVHDERWVDLWLQLAVPPRAPPARLSWAGEVAHLVRAHRANQQRRYRLAPKQSPPGRRIA